MWKKHFKLQKQVANEYVTKCPSFKVQILNNPCINSKTKRAGQLLLRSAASVNTVFEHKGHSSSAEEFFPHVATAAADTDRALQCFKDAKNAVCGTSQSAECRTESSFWHVSFLLYRPQCSLAVTHFIFFSSGCYQESMWLLLSATVKVQASLSQIKTRKQNVMLCGRKYPSNQNKPLIRCLVAVQ